MKHRLLLTSTVIGVTLGFAAEAHAAPTDAAGQNKLATAGAGASNSSSAGATQTQMTPQEQQQLLQEVRSLRERVSVLENKVTAVQSTPPLAKEHKAGDHNLELYGFVQLDAIQDFKRVNPDWDATLRPSRIPTTDGAVRQRRPVDLQRPPIAARGEGDRHARRQAVRGEVRVRPVRRRRRRRPDDHPHPPRLRQLGAVPGRPDQHPVHGRRHLPQRRSTIGARRAWCSLRNPQIRWTFLNERRLDGRRRARASQQRHRPRQHPPDRSRTSRRTSSNDEKLPDLTAAGPLRRRLGPRPACRHPAQDRLRHASARSTTSRTGTRPAGASTSAPRSSLALATLRLGVVYGEGIASYMNDGGMDLAPSVAVIPSPTAGDRRHPRSQAPRPCRCSA